MGNQIKNFATGNKINFSAAGVPQVQGANAAVELTDKAITAGGTGTIATTGNSDVYIIAPHAGTVSSIEYSGATALATSDTNYITWTVTNLGQAGAGTTALLAATNPNTTKATGGSALVADSKRTLTLHGTAANLVVAAGDRLRIRAAATGTLAGAITAPAYCIRYSRTI